MSRLRLALFGSPTFAIPTLEALRHHHDLRLVVTQPDKPAGRGMRLTPPPAARAASRLDLELAQPKRLKGNSDFQQLLEQLELDVAITVAYGKILPEKLLAIPRHGFLNAHASLLPKYRGAAPIQWALINGESETGVTIMQTEAGLDSGPIRHVRKLAISPLDNAITLAEKLGRLSAQALLEALERLQQGRLPSKPQDDAAASYAPLLRKEDGHIDWKQSAEAIFNRFRGVIAWPGSWWLYKQRRLQVTSLRVMEASGQPGKVQAIDESGVLVATGQGGILLEEVQPAGKPRMPARDWANGYGVNLGVELA